MAADVEGAQVRERFAAARVARLATVRADGSPRVVPCWFALEVGGDVLYTAVDDLKPKRTLELGRVDDVRSSGRVSLLVDHDDEDWHRLWWVRVDGDAEVLAPGAVERVRALELLAEKYAPYRDRPPPGAVIAVRATRWTAWP